jgi:Cu-Zn family superoxide dismutase
MRTAFRLRALLAGALSIAALAAAAPAHAALLDAYVIPGDTVFPEGIARDPRSKTFYVGSTTDGTIFRGRADQETLAPFLAGGADERTDVRGLDVDRRGRILAAGGPSGRIWAYSAGGRLIRRFETGTGGFLNDQTSTPRGDAYFTDSRRPAIYKVSAKALRNSSAEWTTLAPWLSLEGKIPFGEGFNLNGIVSSADGRFLITVQSNSGKLWRINVRTGGVREIDLGGATLTGGDGLVLRGRRLSVVRNAAAVVADVRLDRRLRSGRVVAEQGHPDFKFPTTAAGFGRELLVLNSQLNMRGTATPPVLPFTATAFSFTRGR